MDGDPALQPPECPGKGKEDRCPNMALIRETFSGERYRCVTCGASYYLDYDEMR